MGPFKISMVLASIVLIVLALAKKIPMWTMKVYWLTFAMFFLLAEVWMSMGLIRGDADDKRIKTTLPPLANAVIMSMGDGFIGVLQVAIVMKVLGTDAFRSWSWKAAGLMVALGLAQNIPVTYIMRQAIAAGKISWAPLMPVQTKNVIQVQEAWILQPILLYAVLVRWHKELLDL